MLYDAMYAPFVFLYIAPSCAAQTHTLSLSLSLITEFQKQSLKRSRLA